MALLSETLHAACTSLALTQRPDVVVGFNPLAAALVDFDKDGKLDIATPRDSLADGYNVWVQKGNGDGTFQTGIAYPSGTRYAVRLIAADVNNDTWPDLVTANYDTDNISVLLNNGDGTFAEPQVTSSVLSPSRVVAADANHDGHLDIGVVGIIDAQIHFGNGAGTFSGTKVLTFDGLPQDLAFGDFDGSGTTDIAVYGKPPAYIPPTPSEPSTITVHFRASNGTYSTSTITETGNSGGTVVSKDLNGDGKADIVAGHSNRNSLSVHLRSGNGFTVTDYAAGSVVNEIGFADMNEDGKSDIVVATGNAISFPIFLGNGDGTFGNAQQTDVVASQYFLQLQGLGLGDVDGDFRTDVVLVDSSQDKAFIFKNNCSPRYSTTTLASSPNPSTLGQGITLTATIAVSGTTNPTGTVSFYEGDALLGSSPVTPATRTASLALGSPSSGAHSYTATYSGDSEFAESSGTLTHTVNLPPFGVPGSFSATGNPSNGEVSLQWNGTQDATQYEILRQSGGTWSVIATTAATTAVVAPGTGSWFYGVRGVTGTGTRSDWAIDAASTVAFTYPSVSAGTVIHAADVTDLRSIVDGLRGSAGLGGFPYTDLSISGAVIKAAHMGDLRLGLSQAMSAAGMSAPAFGRSITSGLVVLANDLLEMRTKIR